MTLYFITFGQVHAHAIAGKTYDKDCWAELEAPNWATAREIAHDKFGRKFCMMYEARRADEIEFLRQDLAQYYSRGGIELK